MGSNRQGAENPLTDWLARSQYISELLDVRDGVMSIPGQDIGRVLQLSMKYVAIYFLCALSVILLLI